MSRTIDKMIRERTRIEHAMASAPANVKPRTGEHTGPIRYVRAPEYDRRIKNGDDFAGDAYVRWVAVGHTPEQPETLEAERDQLRAREKELVAALERLCSIVQYSVNRLDAETSQIQISGDLAIELAVARVALSKEGA